MLNDNIKPSQIISRYLTQPFGDEWTFSKLISESQKHHIDGISIINDGKNIVAIDNIHDTSIEPSNLHLVQSFPNSINNLMDILIKYNINFDVLNLPTPNPIVASITQTLITSAIFFSLYIAFATFMQNRAMGSMGGNFMDNINELTNSGNIQEDNILALTKFNDVAGCDEAKFELMEIVDFLKNPDKYEEAGAKIPAGVLLEGSPGTGKTLLARAVAGEAGVPFISASGSEFIEMYVGVGASRVRSLFEKAKKNSPCVIFIDEIDAVGRKRGAGIAGGNDEREQTLNQILTNMDGFETKDGIIVLAATNRADILDQALVRPGRFDRKIRVSLPDQQGRKDIAKVHFKNKKLSKNVDFDELASLTSGFSGAEIANLANEAAIFSVRKNETHITRDTLLDAYEKITIGIPSNRQETDPKITELVTYHEVGHAILASIFKDFFNVRKVTIQSNLGGAGGYTLFTPTERMTKYPTKKFFLANLIVAMGGRAAEVYLGQKNKVTNDYDYIFSDFKNLDITTGASGDLLKAKQLAESYITQYGFSEDFNIVHESKELPFLGDTLGNLMFNPQPNSGDIEKEINTLLLFAYKSALHFIIKHETPFLKIVDELKKKRTIDGASIKYFLKQFK
jgi:cell division protease FtsH